MTIRTDQALAVEQSPDAASVDTVVDVAGLRMRYGNVHALQGVDFTVHRGEVFTVLGPNGAGKTTMVEILEGFRRRSDGDVAVLGVDPARGGAVWRAQLGIVLQSWRDHGRWRVSELLAHLARFYTSYSEPRRPRPRDVDELLEIVGLRERAGNRVATLSGGERRRLDVAIGLVGHPRLLFLDEPTAGFDPEARLAFHDVIRNLAAEEDTTIILTTHDLDEAEKLAHRIQILAAGRTLALGTTAELTARVESDVEVRWVRSGEWHTETTPHGADFVRRLFERHGDEITDLEVRRARLEDVYLELVRQHEFGAADEAAAGFPGGERDHDAGTVQGGR